MEYVAATIGALVLVLFWLKLEKDKHDEGRSTYKNWQEYVGKNWDDFLFAIAAANALAFIQEGLFFAIVNYMEYDYEKAINLYFDGFDLVLGFVLGFVGTTLI